MNKQKKNQDEILKDLKEVHNEIEHDSDKSYRGTDNISSSDLASQIEGSDADEDKGSVPVTNAKSKTTQIDGSDSDQDKST